MNWSDRVWVELALISYLIGFAYSVYLLASKKFLTSRISFWAICVGFLWTTLFLFGLYDLVDGAYLPGHRNKLSPLVDGCLYRTGRFRPVVFCCCDCTEPTSVQKGQGQPLARGAYFVLNGGLRSFRSGLHRRRDVPAAGAAIENPPPQFDFLSTPADHRIVSRKLAFAVAGFHALYAWARHRIFDWRPNQLGAGDMVDPGLVRLWRNHRCSNAARHGRQVGCNPVDHRI
jgi:hypothetical protein